VSGGDAGRAVEFVGPERVDVVPIDELDPDTVADEELPSLDGDLSYPLRYGCAAVGRVTAVTLTLDSASRIGERVAVFGQGVVGLLTTALE